MVILMPISDHLQSFTKYLRLPLVFMRNSTLWEKFNACLYIWKTNCLYIYKGTGHWAIILWSLDTFQVFPNFLRS